MDKGVTYLSQTHQAEEILRTYNFWNATPRLTPLQSNMRLNKGNCDKNTAPDLHQRYNGIVCSLGCLITMKRLDLAWAYSELSKYVQIPVKNRMFVDGHVLSYPHRTRNHMICYSRGSHENFNVLWG